MTKETLYTCDVCGKKSSDYEAIRTCECKHLGINREQLTVWKSRLKKFKSACITDLYLHDDETEQAVDETYRALERFEKEHNLIGKKVPKLC